MQISQALQFGKSQLQASSDTPLLDAEILLSHLLQKNRTYLYTWPETPLTVEQKITFSKRLKMRLLGTPIAHITGEREFWGLVFKVNQHTLIPRPDTEILVETALEKLTSLHAPKLLDLGTGSGAVICALKSENPSIKAFAVDLEAKALEIAIENAKNHQLDIEFKQGSWFSPVESEKFDVIVSNPPYIEEEDHHLTEGDVRFEPISALTSGKSGLDDIKLIIEQALNHLNYQAWVCIEHGFNQANAVQTLFKEQGFHNISTQVDYGQNPRVTLAQYLN